MLRERKAAVKTGEQQAAPTTGRAEGCRVAEQRGYKSIKTQNKEKLAVGWGRWFLLGDLGQQFDLADHRRELQELRSQLRAKRSSAESFADQLNDLQRENEELKLYVAALIRLMTTKGIASTEEITSLVDAIDESDGIKDGRYTNKINLAP